MNELKMRKMYCTENVQIQFSFITASKWYFLHQLIFGKCSNSVFLDYFIKMILSSSAHIWKMLKFSFLVYFIKMIVSPSAHIWSIENFSPAKVLTQLKIKNTSASKDILRKWLKNAWTRWSIKTLRGAK